MVAIGTKKLQGVLENCKGRGMRGGGSGMLRGD